MTYGHAKLSAQALFQPRIRFIVPFVEFVRKSSIPLIERRPTRTSEVATKQKQPETHKVQRNPSTKVTSED